MWSVYRQLDEWLKRIEFRRPDGPYTWVITETVDGASFQLSYLEKDTETGEEELQLARPWYVMPGFTFEELVKLCWLAITVSDEHRRREWLLVDDIAVFSPHKPILETLQ